MHGSDESIMYDGVQAFEVPCMNWVSGFLGVKEKSNECEPFISEFPK